MRLWLFTAATAPILSSAHQTNVPGRSKNRIDGPSNLRPEGAALAAATRARPSIIGNTQYLLGMRTFSDMPGRALSRPLNGSIINYDATRTDRSYR
jgi:hypothetical protein